MKRGHWTNIEIKFALESVGILSNYDISKKIGKTEMAVQLFLHRRRASVGNVVKRNLVVELIKLKFIDVSLFVPNRIFYNAVKISQKRWWDLFYGRQPISEPEYIRLITYLGVSLKDAFEARQLNLFEQNGKI